ncbi:MULTISPECIES: hypothetical protein [unclassified Crossiella]|uniref:hypothetical protein n=1 Tax=unclassified Crossiella TaxID=2620835 RepID=UPI001FFFE83B|nr:MULTISPECIES: hypothetical protein [unclassified Crossiella]MCK2239133.1 hypothetical protein [Crossiella sp. S99.2]MCK2251298.1 hypothetical protein [Crossiella sp. S99.1]
MRPGNRVGLGGALLVLLGVLAMTFGPDLINATVPSRTPPVQAGDTRVINTGEARVSLDLTPLAGWTQSPGTNPTGFTLTRSADRLSVEVKSGVQNGRIALERYLRGLGVTEPALRWQLTGEVRTTTGLTGHQAGFDLRERHGTVWLLGRDSTAVILNLVGPRDTEPGIGTLLDLVEVTG